MMIPNMTRRMIPRVDSMVNNICSIFPHSRSSLLLYPRTASQKQLRIPLAAAARGKYPAASPGYRFDAPLDCRGVFD